MPSGAFEELEIDMKERHSETDRKDLQSSNETVMETEAERVFVAIP